MNLNEEDKHFVDSLQLKHIYDLRPTDEAIRKGGLYYPQGCEYHNISAISDAQFARTNLQDFSEENILAHEEWLAEMYGEMPFDNVAYKEIFDKIKKEELPVYFHCSSGKDRTGVLAALILMFFHVDKQTIYDDYMYSYDVMMKLHADKPRIRRYMLVYREWLDNTFQAIQEKYQDDIDRYFLEEYGIDETIRNRLYQLCLEEK